MCAVSWHLRGQVQQLLSYKSPGIWLTDVLEAQLLGVSLPFLLLLPLPLLTNMFGCCSFAILPVYPFALHVSSAFLAQRVSSINSISALCEATDADISEVRKRATPPRPPHGCRPAPYPLTLFLPLFQTRVAIFFLVKPVTWQTYCARVRRGARGP